jgi:hypothetical protein
MRILIQEGIIFWRYCPNCTRRLSFSQAERTLPDEAEFVICDYTIPKDNRCLTRKGDYCTFVASWENVTQKGEVP